MCNNAEPVMSLSNRHTWRLSQPTPKQGARGGVECAPFRPCTGRLSQVMAGFAGTANWLEAKKQNKPQKSTVECEQMLANACRQQMNNEMLHAMPKS